MIEQYYVRPDTVDRIRRSSLRWPPGTVTRLRQGANGNQLVSNLPNSAPVPTRGSTISKR
jgi:hypothetical protein